MLDINQRNQHVYNLDSRNDTKSLFHNEIIIELVSITLCMISIYSPCAFFMSVDRLFTYRYTLFFSHGQVHKNTTSDCILTFIFDVIYRLSNSILPLRHRWCPSRCTSVFPDCRLFIARYPRLGWQSVLSLHASCCKALDATLSHAVTYI